jgi:hypothetical protein
MSPGRDRLGVSVPNPGVLPGYRSRKGSFVSGDDELVEGDEGCGEAVEILSRHSPKCTFLLINHG